MKESIAFCACLALLPLDAFAAGGEINANIYQDNNMNNTTVIGTLNIHKKTDHEYNSNINSIINRGNIQKYVRQETDLDNSTFIDVDINTLDNRGNAETVIQKNQITGSKVIIF